MSPPSRVVPLANDHSWLMAQPNLDFNSYPPLGMSACWSKHPRGGESEFFVVICDTSITKSTRWAPTSDKWSYNFTYLQGHLVGARLVGFCFHKNQLNQARFNTSGFPKHCRASCWSILKCTLLLNTLPKTNIAPENGWLGDYFHFGARPIFRGVCC